MSIDDRRRELDKSARETAARVARHRSLLETIACSVRDRVNQSIEISSARGWYEARTYFERDDSQLVLIVSVRRLDRGKREIGILRFAYSGVYSASVTFRYEDPEFYDETTLASCRSEAIAKAVERFEQNIAYDHRAHPEWLPEESEGCLPLIVLAIFPLSFLLFQIH